MDSTEGKVITCKAAIQYQTGAPVKIENVQVLPPTPGHVRIKMVATALCHSDLAIMSGYKTAVKLPFVPGHEGAGIVESVGQGVTHVKKGDKVFTMYFPHCGECNLCLSKKVNVCMDIRRKIPTMQYMRNVGMDGLTSMSNTEGKPIYQGLGTSSFAEYTVIPANSCVKVHPGTNLKHGCIMACGFLTGYGSSNNVVNIRPGDKVAVWGLGGVGLACVLGCKHKGATQIIGIDVDHEKEAYAKKYGCTDYVARSDLDKGKTMKEKIHQMTANMGLDYAFVCIGSSPTLEEAISCVGVGGTVVMVGVTNSTDTFKMTTSNILNPMTIKGTNYGDYSIFDDVPKMVERYVNGQLPEVDEFVTNTFRIEELNDAINLMKKGKGIRSVVSFE